MRWMYLNGSLVERESAAVSALDRGLSHGYGLFETMRSYTGRVFRLGDHYDRLRDGAQRLAITVPISLDDLTEAAMALLDWEGLPNARLRLTVTADETVVLTAMPLTDYPPELYERGMAAAVSDVRRNETSPLAGVKSLNCLENLLAREEARRRKADEAILLNSRGLVAEGSTSNVFLVRGDTLLTPAIGSGALPGIARRTALELAAKASLRPCESEVAPGAFADAAEAFLTNSVIEVMPLTSLDGTPVGSGRPGPATQRLLRLYREAAEAP